MERQQCIHAFRLLSVNEMIAYMHNSRVPVILAADFQSVFLVFIDATIS